MATVTGHIDFEAMLQNIPAGEKRETAAINLDKFLGISHIPTEGFNSQVVSSAKKNESKKNKTPRNSHSD